MIRRSFTWLCFVVIATGFLLSAVGQDVVTGDHADPRGQPEGGGELAQRIGTALRVQAAGVADHADTPLQARSEDLLHLGQEGPGVPGAGAVLHPLPGQDQHGQLGQPVAGEDVDLP